jgi:ABC-type phosphate transport system substrate-binding protein
MNIKTRRLGLALAAASATVAFAGLGAGGAQAALPGHCLGSNITAQGSSLQGAAQDIWTGAVGGGGFNVSSSGCNGANKPTVAYDRTGSGACLTGFGANGGAAGTTYAFCGTDDAPDSTQIANVTTATGGQVLSIPVAQSAIAIVVNPPAGCAVTTLTPAQIESVFRGATTAWSSIGSGSCSGTITRVVRNDGSGTTYQLKHYLSTINPGAVSGSLTWADLQSAANNTTWPGTVTKSQSGCASAMALPCSGGANSGSGGGDEVRTVGAAGSSIGYAALPDARAVYAALGAPGANTWPNLSWTNIRTGTTTTPNPSLNGVSATKSNSNCPTGNNSYSPLPASGATGDWSGTYRANSGSAYPLCTLTWDLALSNYTSGTWGAGAGSIAQTVKDYLGYAVSAAGQSDALSSANDYQVLPADVLATASAGVAEITG